MNVDVVRIYMVVKAFVSKIREKGLKSVEKLFSIRW